MAKYILTILIIVFMFICCGKYEHKKHIEESTFTTEQYYDIDKYNTKLKDISIYFLNGSGISEIGYSSNNIIDFVKSGKGIDTLKITDKKDELFIHLQRVLQTAVIDSISYIGRPDTIAKYEQVKHIAGIGYVVKRADIGKVDTIAINTYRYNKVLNGKYSDVKPGEVYMFLYTPEENDIAVDLMILYQYEDICIANDTLFCKRYYTPTVRVNSYVAKVDSLSFKVASDIIIDKIIHVKKETLSESNWKHFINNKTYFKRYIQNNEITIYKDSCKNSEILLRTNNLDKGKLYSSKGDWRLIMLRDNEGKEVYGWVYPVDK